MAMAMATWRVPCAPPPMTCTRTPRAPRSVNCTATFVRRVTCSGKVGVEVKDLGVTLGDGSHKAIDNLSVSIPAGQLWMVLGKNGCGKSTLLKALGGLVTPDAGGYRVSKRRAYVFQNPDHQVVMPTAMADVAFALGANRGVDPDTGLKLSAGEVEARVRTSLEAVGLGEVAGRPIYSLSGGQRQRVAIAGALAQRADVLLLDELTTFLDAEDQEAVVATVRHVVDTQGVTALWVTHRMEELPYAHGCVYMEDGRVVFQGSSAEAKRHIDGLRDAFRKQRMK